MTSNNDFWRLEPSSQTPSKTNEVLIKYRNYAPITFIRQITVLWGIAEREPGVELMFSSPSIAVAISKHFPLYSMYIGREDDLVGTLFISLNGRFTMQTILQKLAFYTKKIEGREIQETLVHDLCYLNHWLFMSTLPLPHRYPNVQVDEPEPPPDDQSHNQALIFTIKSHNHKEFRRLLMSGYSIRRPDHLMNNLLLYILYNCKNEKECCDFLKTAAVYGANLFAPCGPAFFRSTLELLEYQHKNQIKKVFMIYYQSGCSMTSNPNRCILWV